jgi:hypothetical protein
MPTHLLFLNFLFEGKMKKVDDRSLLCIQREEIPPESVSF